MNYAMVPIAASPKGTMPPGSWVKCQRCKAYTTSLENHGPGKCRRFTPTVRPIWGGVWSMIDRSLARNLAVMAQQDAAWRERFGA